MKYFHRRTLLYFTVFVFALALSCAPNAGKDGSTGTAGADGEEGIPGPAGQDGSGGSGSAPQSPSDLTTEADGPTTIVLRWTFNTGSELGFNIQRMENEDRGDWETIAGTAANVTVFHDENVECEHAYIYRVLAYNDYGESQPSNEEEATADWCPVSAPSGLYAQVLGPNEVRLSWDDNADNHDGFRIYRDDTELTTVGTATPFYDDTGLDCETLYRYRVTAYNANVESDFSNAAVGETDYCPVATPENLIATGVDIDEIVLTWDDVSSNETNFEIQRREAGSGEAWDTLAVEVANTEQYSDLDVECRIDYEYRVKAYNANVESTWSDTNTGQTVGCMPIRPRPVLESIDPESYFAFSREYLENPPDPLYPVTISGTGIAADTQVIIGDFLIDCETGNHGEDCEADELGQPLPGTCATQCVAAMPPDIMKNADIYVLRLITPDPVFGGNGMSADHAFFNVLAPQPIIDDIWPRGAFQELDRFDHPMAQDLTIMVWGRNIMNNVVAKIGNNFGDILQFDTDEVTGEQMLYARVSTEGLYPSEEPYDFALVNSGPGGGERTKPFGLRGVVSNWGDDADGFVYPDQLNQTDACGVRPLQYKRYGRPSNASTLNGVAWNFPSGHVAVRDSAGNLLMRVNRDSSPAVIPLPGKSSFIDIQNPTGNKRAFTLTSPPTTIYRGGSGAFNSPELSVSGYANFLATGDINNDGILDVVFSQKLGGSFKRGLGDGNGAFDIASVGYAGMRPQGIALGDFNSDNNLDVVVADWYYPYVVIRDGLGNGSFDNWRELPMGRSPYDVEVADFNGDGFADIASSNEDSDDFSVRFGDGDGGFGGYYDHYDYPMGDEPYGLDVADLNGDSLLDVVVANYGSNDISVRLGIGDGIFGEKVDYAADASPRDVQIADLDGDGAPDMVSANYTSGINIRFGDGRGGFGGPSAYTSLSMGGNTARVTVADLNGDSYPDIATANWSGSHVNAFSIRYNDGQGDFSALQNINSGYSGSFGMDLSIGDANNDGAPDLISCIGLGSSATFRIATHLANGDEELDDRFSMGTCALPLSISSGDTNGDGKMDFVFSCTSIHIFRTYTNNGSGSFTYRGGYSTQTGPQCIKLEQLTSDQALDVVTANDGSDSISVSVGNGNGTFAGANHYAMGDGPNSVAAGDFDGFGGKDIVTANSNSDDISIRYNQGAGYFGGIGDHTDLPMGDSPRSVAVGDFDGINGLDIAVAAYEDDQVVIRYNDGSGDFSNPANLAVFNTGGEPISLAVGDLDSDGAPELITSNSKIGDVSILWNDGIGSFDNVDHYSLYATPWAAPNEVTIADVDGNGHEDVVIGDGTGVSIFYNQGSGQLSLKTHFEYDLADALAIADFDSDGVNDIASVAGFPDTMTVIYSALTGNWRQELTQSFSDDSNSPWLPKFAPAGNATTLQVHQGRQNVIRMAVRVLLEWATQPSGSVSLNLRAPDGVQISLGTHSEFHSWPDDLNPTAWRLNETFPESEYADLVILHGEQPNGDWELTIQNSTGADAEVKNFTVITDGNFN